MQRIALLTAAASIALSGAAFAQTNGSDPGFPPGPPLPSFDEQTAQLPPDTDPPADRNKANAPLDRRDAPNTPMQNGGLPNGEGAPTGANSVRY